MESTFLYVAGGAAVVALVFAFIKYGEIMKRDAGSEKMQDISKLIQDGAKAFLVAEYKWLTVFVIVVAAAIGLSGQDGLGPKTAVAFVTGAIASGLAGYFGMHTATRSLGVGDAWDVESGVQSLIDRGLADPEKVGAMGWSQGGYISAFLATNSTMFRAISNGAGISNWMTYYVNTDIHGFTRNYLEATPWDDPEIYARTSPMTNIKRARTPTLIQHGENDARVPPPNAFELYQGLRDVGVETRLIVYERFGHGINRPKEQLAANWHNYQWFAKHLWGRDVEIPVDKEDGDQDDEEDAQDAEDGDGEVEETSEVRP